MTVSQRVIAKLKWGELKKHSSQGLAHIGTQGLLESFPEGFMENGGREQQRFHGRGEGPAESRSVSRPLHFPMLFSLCLNLHPNATVEGTRAQHHLQGIVLSHVLSTQQ